MKLIEYINILNNLLKIAERKKLNIKIADFKSSADALLKGNRIGISSKLPLNELNFVLAHEIAHYYLHYDKGNTIKSPRHKEYEEQANRTAELILDLLSMDMDSCNVGGAN